MPRSENTVHLLGYVGSDPEIRQAGGQSLAKVSLATSPPWDAEETNWHSLTFWRKLADIVEQYVSKGDRIYVQGRVTYDSWTDNNGNTRKSTEIVVEDMIMLGSRSGGSSRPQTQADEVSDEEMPF